MDLAAGEGRHARYLLDRGHRVVAVDVDTAGLADLESDERMEVVEADLEAGAWPLEGRSFDGIVVVNYLHRPLLPLLVNALKPEGVLIYDTFAEGNERYGRPKNPDFLLRERELMDAFSDLDVVAYEHGVRAAPRPSVRQSICARYCRRGSATVVSGLIEGEPHDQDPEIHSARRLHRPRRLQERQSPRNRRCS